MAKKVVYGVEIDTKDAQGSIDKLNEKLKELNKNAEENADAIKEVTDAIEDLGKEGKDSGDGLLDSFSNLPGIFGQIGSSIKGAITGFKNLVTSAKNLKNIGLVSTLTSVASAFGLGTAAAGTFAVALTATGIGALVVALGALIAYFTQTEEGVETLAVAMDTLGEVVATIGDAFAALVDLDFGAFVRGLTVDLFNNTAAAYENARALQAIKDAERELNVERAEARTRIKELNLLVEDTTKSIEERIAAAQEAGEIERRNLEQDRKINDEKIRRLRAEIATRRDATDEQKDQLAELLIAQEQFNQESLELQTTLNNKLNILLEQRRKAIAKATNSLYNDQEDLFLAELELSDKLNKAQTDLLKARFKAFKNNKNLEKEVIGRTLEEELTLVEEFNKKETDLTKRTFEDNLKALELSIKTEQTKIKQAAREKLADVVGDDAALKELIEKRNQDLENLEKIRIAREKVLRQELANDLFVINKASEEEQTKIVEDEARRRLDAIKKRTEKRLAEEEKLKAELKRIAEEKAVNDKFFLDKGIISIDAYYTEQVRLLTDWYEEQKILLKDNQKALDELDATYYRKQIQLREEQIEFEKQYWKERADITREQAAKIAEIFAGENGLSEALNTSFTNIFDGVTMMLETFNNSNSTLLDNTMATLGTIQSAIQAVGDVSNAVTEQRLANIDAELQAQLFAYGEQKNAGIISETEYQNAVYDARLTAYREEEKLRKKSFEQNKALGIVNAVLSTAQAVISAFNAGASMGPAGVVMGPVMAGIAAAVGAAQIAVIASQKYTPGQAPTRPPVVQPPSTSSGPNAGQAMQPNIEFAGTGTYLNTIGGGANEFILNSNVSISETEITSTQVTVSEYEQASLLSG